MKNSSSDDEDLLDANNEYTEQDTESVSIPKRSKIFGCVFVSVYLALLFGGGILIAIGFKIAGGIIFGSSFLMIICSGIVSSVISARSKSKAQSSYKSKYAKSRNTPRNSNDSGSDALATLGTTVSCKRVPTSGVDFDIYLLKINANGEEYTKVVNVPYEIGETIPVTILKNSGVIKLHDRRSAKSNMPEQSRLDSIAYAAEHPPANTSTAFAETDDERERDVLTTVADERSDILRTTNVKENTLSAKSATSPSVTIEKYSNAQQPLERSEPQKSEENSDKTHKATRPNVGYKAIKRKK